MLPFLAGTLAMSVVVTAIFNATGGSLLPIILLHGAMNTWSDLFGSAGSSSGMASISIAPMVLLVIVVAPVCGPVYLPASQEWCSPRTGKAKSRRDH